MAFLLLLLLIIGAATGAGAARDAQRNDTRHPLTRPPARRYSPRMILINYSTCRRRAFTSHGITADTMKGSTMTSNTTRVSLRVDIEIDTELLHADYPNAEGRETEAITNWVALAIGDSLRGTDDSHTLTVKASRNTVNPCDCRYSANPAEVSRAFAHYSGYVAQWQTAGDAGATRDQKINAADQIGLNLQNLPNFDRPTAIGLAEVLLRHLVTMTGVGDYYGADFDDDADTLPVVDTECPACGGDGIIPALGRGAYVTCPTCTDH